MLAVEEIRAASIAADLSVDRDSLVARVGAGAEVKNAAVREYSGKAFARDFLPHKAPALTLAAGAIKRLADAPPIVGRPAAWLSPERGNHAAASTMVDAAAHFGARAHEP